MDTQTTAATEVKVPDIGDFKDVAIIDIHVKVGDPVNAEDPLITLESDKATMDVPAPSATVHGGDQVHGLIPLRADALEIDVGEADGAHALGNFGTARQEQVTVLERFQARTQVEAKHLGMRRFPVYEKRLAENEDLVLFGSAWRY